MLNKHEAKQQFKCLNAEGDRRKNLDSLFLYRIRGVSLVLFRRFLFLSLTVGVLSACTSNRQFMTTPNLYINDASYKDAAPELSAGSSDLNILYVTDRLNESSDPSSALYLDKRSSAVEFGEVNIPLKPAIDWQALSDASDGQRNIDSLSYGASTVVKRGQYPDSPYLFSVEGGEAVIDPQTLVDLAKAKDNFSELIKQRLTLQNSNEAIVFIHGFNNTFDHAAQSLSGIWHFLHRKPVPILYSWPAGAGGIRGYFVDRESGEFTIFHLKEMLRTLFEIPELEKIHIIAHSRGADTMTSALRELVIEQRGKGIRPKEQFKIANLILAAPDLDYGVIRQRLMAEAFATAIGQITVYSTSTDKALTISQALTRSIRFGLLASEDIDVRDRSILERVGNVDFIQAQNVRSFTGHDYFISNPAVSADLLTTIKDGAKAGSDMRPLVHEEGRFWLLPDGYLQ